MKKELSGEILEKQITKTELSERLAFIQEMLRELSDQVTCSVAGNKEEWDSLAFLVAEMLDARVSILNCTDILGRSFIDKSKKHSLIDLGFKGLANNPELSKQLWEKRRQERKKMSKPIGENDVNSQAVVN